MDRLGHISVAHHIAAIEECHHRCNPFDLTPCAHPETLNSSARRTGHPIRVSRLLRQGCAYRPDRRVGPQACPVTAGYWALIARHEESWARHPRMAQPVRGWARLSDREELLAQEAARGSEAP